MAISRKTELLIMIGLTLCALPLLSATDDSGLYESALDDILNTCMDARHHKSSPGPEDSLHAQCSPWASRSCCTANTSINLHYTNMYKFDWSHCSGVAPLSDTCRKHFRQDLCFYECSPNVGPWLVKVQQKIRKQRFMNVPLCRSDCEAWFHDCLDDYTCTDNWGMNFQWKEFGNICPEGSKCMTFRQIYNNNATYFCETVWDHSWKVVNDDEHCMRLWFKPEFGNPNDRVARWKAEEMVKYQIEQISAAQGNIARAVVNLFVPFTVVVYIAFRPV